MNLFEAMLVGHLTGDFLLQTRWMAYNKENSLGPLSVHSAVYTLCVFVFAWPVGTLPVWSVLLVFCSHMFLDRRRFVRWWMLYVNGNSTGQQESTFMKMIIDQSFHILVLALVTYGSVII